MARGGVEGRERGKVGVGHNDEGKQKKGPLCFSFIIAKSLARHPIQNKLFPSFSFYFISLFLYFYFKEI
jgi:hypothetical protein